jgi:hypothetical protein
VVPKHASEELEMTLTRAIVHASIFAALLAGLAGCATLRTSADYDSHAGGAGRAAAAARTLARESRG